MSSDSAYGFSDFSSHRALLLLLLLLQTLHVLAATATAMKVDEHDHFAPSKWFAALQLTGLASSLLTGNIPPRPTFLMFDVHRYEYKSDEMINHIESLEARDQSRG